MAAKKNDRQAPEAAREENGGETTAAADLREFAFLSEKELTAEQEGELAPLAKRWANVARLLTNVATMTPAKAQAAKREHDEAWAALRDFGIRHGFIVGERSPPPQCIESLRQRVRQARVELTLLQNGGWAVDEEKLADSFRELWQLARDVLSPRDRPEEREVVSLTDADNALDRLESALAGRPAETKETGNKEETEPEGEPRPALPTAAYCLLPRHEARWTGCPIQLAPLLWQMLEALLNRAAYPVDEDELARQVWGESNRTRSKTIANTIQRLNAHLTEIGFPLTWHMRRGQIWRQG